MIGCGIKDHTTIATIQSALDAGYDLFDSKDTNASLAAWKQIRFRRESVRICSKLMGETHPTTRNHHPLHIEAACRRALRTAGLEYWDIYYIHTMHSFGNVPILDTYRGLLALKERGLTRQIGVSNITLDQLRCLSLRAPKPDYVQVEIHPYLTECRLVEYCRAHDIRVVAHSPLGSTAWHDLSVDPRLVSIAQRYQRTVAQIILQWHVQRGVIPIPSSTKEHHLRSNRDPGVRLTADEMDRITSMDQNRRIYVKPNHPESIGRHCRPLPARRWSPIPADAPPIVHHLFEHGFYSTGGADHPLSASAKEIREYLDAHPTLPQNNMHNRPYEKTYNDPWLDDTVRQLVSHPWLSSIVDSYMNGQSSLSRAYVKTSCPTSNLCPQKTGLFHRDLQRQPCLKVILYVSEVDETRGPVRIVRTDRDLTSLTWYLEREIQCPRTTEHEILRRAPAVSTAVWGPSFSWRDRSSIPEGT